MPSLVEILNSKIGAGGKSKAYVASKLSVGEKTIENYMRGLRNRNTTNKRGETNEKSLFGYVFKRMNDIAQKLGKEISYQ